MKTIYRLSTLVGFCLLFIVTTGCGQPTGETVAQASSEAIEPVDFKKQFEDNVRRAEEAQLREQELQQRRRSFIEVAFHEFDAEGRVVVAFTNKTGKPIDDIRGGFTAEDSDGNYLASSGFTIATPGDLFLAIDATAHHAPFMSRRPNLIERLETRPETVRFSFEASEIIYADGSAEPDLGAS